MIIVFNQKDVLEILDPHPELEDCIVILTKNASYTFRHPVALFIGSGDNDRITVDTEGY
jgi:hypothetical protein